MNINNHPLYRTWAGMVSRCHCQTADNFKWYGGRGIKVCDRWRNSSRAFIDDVSPKPKGTTLDRINPDGDYEPGNVRWVSQKEQVNNSRTVRLIEFRGERLTLTQWAARIGIKPPAMHTRLQRHPLDVALTMPANVNLRRCK